MLLTAWERLHKGYPRVKGADRQTRSILQASGCGNHAYRLGKQPNVFVDQFSTAEYLRHHLPQRQCIFRAEIDTRSIPPALEEQRTSTTGEGSVWRDAAADGKRHILTPIVTVTEVVWVTAWSTGFVLHAL